MTEIMSALYLGIMNIDPDDLKNENRDRFILSKGHGVLAQYTALKQLGIISDAELMGFKKSGTRLFAHPSKNPDIGIEFSSGSLGQGISLAVGTAMALKRKNNPARVFVLVGDGECDEGSVWEATASAAHFQLDNLTIIVDKNELQYDGRTSDILNMENLSEKFSAFGFDVKEADGHNIEELLTALEYKSSRPIALIAHTVKGKGVSFMENNPVWHNGKLTEKQYLQAMNELGAGND